MKKILLMLVVLVVIAGAWYLASPLFLNREVHEAAPTPMATTTRETIARGTFRDADSFHKTAGTATLSKIDGKYYLRFEDDFSTTNGPDLFVHFMKNGAYDPNARIAALKGNIGSQNYEVPANLNPADYDGIVIWCRAFSVLFGTARWE